LRWFQIFFVPEIPMMRETAGKPILMGQDRDMVSQLEREERKVPASSSPKEAEGLEKEVRGI